VWIHGAWRPWWKFRDWDYLDALRAGGAIVLAFLAPWQLANRVVVDRNAIQQSNALGLRAARRIEWTELSRLQLRADQPPRGALPDDRREHDKQPTFTAVLKNGDAEEFRGWLIDAAMPEIARRAREAGVIVGEAGLPGIAPPGRLPGARPFPGP
jgi:hypothetical protein